ncbi:histidine phosphatase family protein [Nocardia aurea]|uniref:histidine phosphatase family protein n=1 Tax=Nocardia aurea TaxID=2144174 RepID=UPI000D686975|nr:histidine phosphatase family protein [Nocardia aurea]
MSLKLPAGDATASLRPCAHGANAGPAALLYAVRHGQSTVNAGIRPATPADADDMRIELTELGRRQAAAFGRWLASRPAARRPELVLCSPYLRAVTTWQLAAAEFEAAGVDLPCLEVHDQLYDRHRGERARLSISEVRERFPQEFAAEQADPLGFRPPGGESFHDVATRLGDVAARIERDRQHRSVLIVAHDAVVLMLRRILEKLRDDEILAIAEDGLAGNASVTTWERDERGFRLMSYDERAHLA